MKKINPDYFRNFVFGAEDSLVSTVGVLFGLATSGEYLTKQLILAGIVLLTVEALSMGAGSYLTETEVHSIAKKGEHKDSPIIDALIMFFSYLISGVITLTPYFLLPQNSARFYSVGLTLVALYLLGFLPSKNPREGVRMVTIAGGAILIGFVVARIFGNLSV